MHSLRRLTLLPGDVMTDDEVLEVGEEAPLGPSLADCNFRFFVPRKYGKSGGSIV